MIRTKVNCLANGCSIFRCLRSEGCSERVIWRAIRQSVRGIALEILRCLREDASLHTVLSGFGDAFRSYLSKDQSFPLFYAAQQGAKESIAVWGCRLEDIYPRLLSMVV